MEDIGRSRAYLLFAKTRVLSEPIDGDRISTRSPGFKKRSGAEVLSGNNSLESAAVPAAVPPLMMSPGYSVKSRDRYSRYSPNVNTISREVIFLLPHA